MRKARGRVEMALEAIFANSDAEFTTQELTRLVYSGRLGLSDNTVRLAMKRIEKRVALKKRHVCCRGGGWTWGYRRQ